MFSKFKLEPEVYKWASSLSEWDRGAVRNALDAAECDDEFGCHDAHTFAERIGKEPICPYCGSESAAPNGVTPQGKRRWLCGCGKAFTILTGTAIASAKIPLWVWGRVVRGMGLGLTERATADLFGIAPQTADLCRRKVFASIASIQGEVILSGSVWFDEIYTFDDNMPATRDGRDKRGLSGKKYCVCLAIDSKMDMVAFVAGHGYPTCKEVERALGDHIERGSSLIHDACKSHSSLVSEVRPGADTVVKSSKDPASLKAMALVNYACAWLRRHLRRYTGMDTDNLQDYLNWFVFLFKCRKGDEETPAASRILQNLILAEARCIRTRTRREMVDALIRKGLISEYETYSFLSLPVEILKDLSNL